jgi:plasmid stabilization system protein ParE
MTRKIVRHDEFRRNIVDLALAIARDSETMAQRFFDASDATLERLAQSPGLGSLLDPNDANFENVRLWRVRGFPRHIIFYRDLPDQIQAIRAVHASTDWQSTLRLP